MEKRARHQRPEKKMRSERPPQKQPYQNDLSAEEFISQKSDWSEDITQYREQEDSER